MALDSEHFAASFSDTDTAKESSKKRKPKFRKLKQRTIIQQEAHALANTLLGRKDIPQIVETATLWQEDS